MIKLKHTMSWADRIAHYEQAAPFPKHLFSGRVDTEFWPGGTVDIVP
jgi:hypothetical protein